jgi:formylglycine-generating enzyme required for sulfatase activity
MLKRSNSGIVQRMATFTVSAVFAATCALSAGAALLREPDIVYYGSVARDGTVLDADSAAVVSARRDLPGGGSEEVASYTLGDPLPGGDTPPRDGAGRLLYLVPLPIEIETNAPEPRTPRVLRAGDTVKIFVDGVEVAEVLVEAPGIALRLNLDVDADGGVADSDGDGIADFEDNCGGIANATQADANGNGIGDACDCTLAPGPDCVNPGTFLVQVSHADNPADARSTAGLGRVTYLYEIQETEVTNAQYRDMLASVAANDSKGQFNELMKSDQRGGITRSGAAGTYLYQVKPNMADKPVNFVSWLDAARYANWLENGQPAGGQDATTTETGAFDLTASADPARDAQRNPAAAWRLPDENEWYKAAYYDPDRGNVSDYWEYPTRSDDAPFQAGANSTGDAVSSATGNIANYASRAAWNDQHGNVTTVASANDSASFYQTFDQAGNVAEWLADDANLDGLRLTRGGSYAADAFALESEPLVEADANKAAADRLMDPSVEGAEVGFRVVLVAAAAVDTDEDEVPDAEDNCIEVANADQLDADLDGFGNVCDCDFNNDGGCGQPDYTILLACFNKLTGPGTGPADDPTCEASDMNGDGGVGQPDYSLFLPLLGGPPGPSGLVQP